MLTREDVIEKLRSGELTPQDIAANGWMCSVTQRISKIKQPRGGYIKPKEFEQTMLDGGGIDELHPEENVSPSLVGIAVDYLTRFMSGTSVEEAFKVSKLGAHVVRQRRLFKKLLSNVYGLDDESIVAAVKLSGFDSAYRAGVMAYRPVEDIEPDGDTVENIRTMVERSLRFFNQYGPKVMDGLTFEGGYTGYVATGDGDFLTNDTLWDFKVSKQKLQNKYTLQLLMYWRMGLHSIHPEYENVKYLGVYNPRMNIVYRLDVNDIPADVISTVETEVIGY